MPHAYLLMAADEVLLGISDIWNRIESGVRIHPVNSKSFEDGYRKTK